MRTLLSIALSAVVLAVAGLGSTARGQVASQNVTTLLENPSVRVTQVQFAPGGVSAMSARRARVIYPFGPGKLQITFRDGKTQLNSFNSGRPFWRDGETTEVRNVGDAEVKLLIVEQK